MVRKSVFKYRCIFIWCCLCCVSIVKAQVRDLESPYYIYPRQAEQHIDLSQSWELSSEEIPVENLAKLKENQWHILPLFRWLIIKRAYWETLISI